MLREHDRNKGSNTRRRPLLGITILDEEGKGLGWWWWWKGGVKEEGKGNLSWTFPVHFTSDWLGENPTLGVFLAKNLCLETETKTHVSKILPDQFTFDWMNNKQRGQKDCRTTYFKRPWFWTKRFTTTKVTKCSALIFLLYFLLTFYTSFS